MRAYGNRRRRPSDVLLLALIIFLAVVAAFPLLWMVLSSLKTPAETMQTPPVWLPASPNLNAYGEVAGVINAGRSFLNSAAIASVTTLGIVVT
ncbi:carbohydrate ABC transporter permease, partial [Rhizobiaceae sp. 2RAB30]